jgi:threonine dehydratase
MHDGAPLQAMAWLYKTHGIRVEPSGAITTAALLQGKVDLSGTGDIVVVISGRNLDEDMFQGWIKSKM